MALFGKKTCPNCGQPQEKNWDKCPFCVGMAGAGMPGMGPGGPPMGGPPMGGMGAAMGGAPGMPPPGAFGGFGGGAPSGATQFGGGSGYGPPPSGFGGPPPGGPPPAFGGPPAGFGGPPPSTAQKTVMFGVGQGPSGAVQLLGWLVPLKGSHRGELHTLKPQTVVGKDPTCDIVFNDAFMSSRHATFRAQGGVFVVEDHSSNGTFVNDKKVSRHELVDSDILKLGQTLVKFKQL
jgi:hypothetical protein